MASYSLIAVLTDEARERIAQMTISGTAFQVTKFVVGSGGHDPGDNQTPLTPDPAVQTLPGQTFGPKNLVSPSPGQTGILITPTCPQFTGLLDYNEANGQLSNVGLIATITYPLSDPDFGTEFLFAVGNRALINKTDGDQIQINVTLQT